MDCNKVNIKKGSKGSDVKELQEYLNWLGYYKDEIDSSCGNVTVKAIKEFQKNNNLKQDGNFAKLSCQASCINGCNIDNSNLTLDIGTWLNMVRRFQDYTSSHNNTEPNIIYINKANTYRYVSKAKYKEIYTRFSNYVKQHNHDPSFMYINYPTTSTSTTSNTSGIYKANGYYTTGIELGQITSYHCAPHCIKQLFKHWSITGWSERFIGQKAGTTTDGTGHSGIDKAINYIADYEKIKVKIEWKHFSDLASTRDARFKKLGELISDPKKGVITHVMYKLGQANKGRGYGHYEVPDQVNTKNNTLRILNSLGTRKYDGSYYGYLETRSYATESYWMSGISQPSLCIVTRQ